jgi:hypothetical protein
MREALPLVVFLAVGLAASCGEDRGQSATPAPPSSPQTSAQPGAGTPLPPPPGPPATGQGQAGQTIQVPGLGSITLNIPGVTSPAPGSAGQAPDGSVAGGRQFTRVPPAAPPPAFITPAGALAESVLQSETRSIHAALLAALPEAQRARVAPVPLEIVAEAAEPNAAAACGRDTGRSVVVVTTAMLTLCSGIAETRASDELSGGTAYDQYARTVASSLQGHGPVQGVQPGLVPAATARDQRKLARQLQLFQQQIAFILAHEMAHHHRGHTSCVGSGDAGRAQAEELARIASSALPTFTQPLEVEADTWAVSTVLAAGSGRPGGSWDEEGALVNLDFFGRLHDLGGADILQVFLSTHPLPQIRRPIIQVAAGGWAPGRWPPGAPAVGSGLPLPGGGTLPIQIPGLTTQ